MELLVKVVLTGEHARKFQEIQKRYGVLNRSEVVRICINSVYDELIAERRDKPR